MTVEFGGFGFDTGVFGVNVEKGSFESELADGSDGIDSLPPEVRGVEVSTDSGSVGAG